jgi:hypothetical protein
MDMNSPDGFATDLVNGHRVYRHLDVMLQLANVPFFAYWNVLTKPPSSHERILIRLRSRIPLPAAHHRVRVLAAGTGYGRVLTSALQQYSGDGLHPWLPHVFVASLGTGDAEVWERASWLDGAEDLVGRVLLHEGVSSLRGHTLMAELAEEGAESIWPLYDHNVGEQYRRSCWQAAQTVRMQECGGMCVMFPNDNLTDVRQLKNLAVCAVLSPSSLDLCELRGQQSGRVGRRVVETVSCSRSSQQPPVHAKYAYLCYT